MEPVVLGEAHEGGRTVLAMECRRVQISEREAAMAWAEPEGSLEDRPSGWPGSCSHPEADVRVLWGRVLPAEKGKIFSR